jgi:streptogramin lyase
MWFANRGNSTITYLPLSASGVYTASSETVYGTTSTLGSPTYLVVDGNGNVWTTDNAQTSPGSIEELNSSGTAISPSSAGTAPFNVLGYSHVGIGTGAGIAVDPSGNVWVANNSASGVSSVSVFELVGAAAPTITPIAAALVGSKVGTKP